MVGAMLTFQRLQSVVSYNGNTGEFTWLRRDGLDNWNTRWAGKVAGTSHNGGYLCVCIDGVKYLSHRLAWFHVYGEFPSIKIDHRNLNKKDNRISNLRLATDGQSSQNISLRKSSSSGFRGVWFRKDRGVWCAQINANGKKRHLGSFKTAEDAHFSYALAAKQTYKDFCPVYLQEAI